jgi:hypothetical protein
LVIRHLLLALLLLFAASCSRLDTLTEAALSDAEATWNGHAPGFYRMVVKMTGDRLEEGVFEVVVRDRSVVSLSQNGQAVLPDRAQDYSVDGLFDILARELALAEEPSVLDAPEGYGVYLLARFDSDNGRLIRYLRSVGGTNNNIEIHVTEFEPR